MEQRGRRREKRGRGGGRREGKGREEVGEKRGRGREGRLGIYKITLVKLLFHASMLKLSSGYVANIVIDNIPIYYL